MHGDLKKLSQVIPLGSILKSTGTYTNPSNAGLPYLSKSAAAETTKLTIPLSGLIREDVQFGLILDSIEVPVRIATASLVTNPTATLYKRNVKAVTGAGTDQTASSVTITKTGFTKSAAATDRKLNIAVTTPALDYTSSNGIDYVLELNFQCATTTALRVYSPIVHYRTPQ